MSTLRSLGQLDLLAWLYSLWVAVVGGAVNALLAAVGTTVTGALPLTPRQLVTIAGAGAIVALLMFLKQSPAPRIIDESRDETK
jgi:hypothetical protein